MALTKILYSFIKKELKKLWITDICRNMIKIVNEKPIANIMLRGEMEQFFLNLEWLESYCSSTFTQHTARAITNLIMTSKRKT